MRIMHFHDTTASDDVVLVPCEEEQSSDGVRYSAVDSVVPYSHAKFYEVSYQSIMRILTYYKLNIHPL